jgi:hypothetical protein
MILCVRFIFNGYLPIECLSQPRIGVASRVCLYIELINSLEVQ